MVGVLAWSHGISRMPQGDGLIGGLLKSTTRTRTESGLESDYLVSAVFSCDINGNVVLFNWCPWQVVEKYALPNKSLRPNKAWTTTLNCYPQCQPKVPYENSLDCLFIVHESATQCCT
jgi:hypothetical protein